MPENKDFFDFSFFINYQPNDLADDGVLHAAVLRPPPPRSWQRGGGGSQRGGTRGHAVLLPAGQYLKFFISKFVLNNKSFQLFLFVTAAAVPLVYAGSSAEIRHDILVMRRRWCPWCAKRRPQQGRGEPPEEGGRAAQVGRET